MEEAVLQILHRVVLEAAGIYLSPTHPQIHSSLEISPTEMS